ncbi:MAG: hypothetical protein WBE64_21525, partial [Xanthobacteraceae bacterium]
PPLAVGTLLSCDPRELDIAPRKRTGKAALGSRKQLSGSKSQDRALAIEYTSQPPMELFQF